MNINFAQARVLVIGDVMLDRYWHGSTQRISPEAPIPIVTIAREEQRPGGAANVALNAATLGADVTLIGVVGEDESANQLHDILSSAGVHCAFIKSKNIRTTEKLRILGQEQQMLRADFENELTIEPRTIGKYLEEYLATADVIICSDYNKGALHHIELLISMANDAGKIIIVDPKGLDFGRYSKATTITPNAKEFEAVVGSWQDENDFINKAQLLIETTEINSILVTRGDRGMTWVSNDSEVIHVPTVAQEIFDVSGAGDTVIATLGICMALRMPIKQALTLANNAAGIVVGKQGTAIVTPAELNNRATNTPSKVYSSDALQQIVRYAQERGETVVMTNGCFDILHSGHIDSLRQAKEHGERLIIALNSDASIKRLKGEQRPINSLEHRIAVLQALSYVDWIVVFGDDPEEHDCPEKLYSQLLPDVIAKGGDYTEEQVAGSEAVKSNGGKVVIIDFIDNISTSSIITKIKEG